MATKAFLEKAYLAYFGRPVDPIGLTDFASSTETQVADAFAASAESQALYGTTFNFEQINAIYMALFNRPAEKAGLEYWYAKVADKTYTAAGAAIAILNGAKNADKTAIENKLAASAAFSAALDTSAEMIGYSGTEAAASARAFLSTVTATAATPAAINAAVAAAVAARNEGVGQAFTLTTGVDAINFPGSISTVNTVYGVLGNTDLNSSLAGTFSLGDTIAGNGLTKLELTVSSQASTANTSLVEMSGVNSILFKASATQTVELDGSTFGSDVSKVSATGVRDATLGVTGLATEGAFTLETTPTYGGTLYVGAVDFDNSFAGDIAGSNDIGIQGEDIYDQDPISTDLYSTPGVDANLYIDSGANGGGSSVRLLTNEIEVNAGAGRSAAADAGDAAGAHVFNYVNATDDLITAPEISVALVDINVAKGAFGEVVISNFAEKTADMGDAEALGVDVDAVDIDVEDVASAIFEVRNMAANYVNGDDDSDNPAVYAGDITIGQIDANAKTDSDVYVKVLQLAGYLGSETDESATAGNVTIGNITATGNGSDAGNFDAEIVNKVELSHATGNDVLNNVEVTVGNVTIADVEATGWSSITVDIQNVVDIDAMSASADLSATVTVGDLTVSSVSLDGSGSVNLHIADGNSDDYAQGSMTVGDMTVGNITVASGGSGSVTIERHATAIDDDATIGQTDIAVGGNVEIHSDNASNFDLHIHADGVGESSVGRVRIGNVDVGSTGGSVDVDITAEVSLTDDAAFGSASVANVTIGNVTADASDTSSNNAEAHISIKAQADFTTSSTLTADDVAGASATIGNVVIGNVSATIVGSDDAGGVDAYVDITVEADSVNGDATVGTVTIGNLSAVASDEVSIDVQVLATAAAGGDAAVGNVRIGNVNMAKSFDNSDSSNLSITVDAYANNAAAANATIGTVIIGDITMVGGTEDTFITINVNANADVTDGTDAGTSVARVGMVTIGDVEIDAEEDGSITVNVELDAMVSGDGTATITGLEVGTIDLASETDSADVTIAVDAFVTDDGDATVSNVTLGNMLLTVTSDSASVDIDVHALVSDAGTASVDGIDIGTITEVAGTSADIEIDIDAQAGTSASVSEVTIADITMTAGEDASLDITINAQAGTSASVSEVTIADITMTAGEDASLDITINASASDSASISDVTIAGIEMTAGEDATAEIDIYAFAAEGASISDVSIADITADGERTGTINISIWGEDFSGSGDATVSAIDIGNLQATGSTGDGEINIDVIAYAELGNASVDDITIGNLDSLSEFTDANVAVIIAAIQGENFNTSSSVTADSGTGVASVSNVTVGDIHAQTTAGTSNSNSSVSFTIEVGAFGNDASVSNVTFGNLTASANDSRTIDMNIDVEAIATNSVSFSGDYIFAEGSATISNVTFGNIAATSSGSGDVNVNILVGAYASITEDMAETKIASITDVTIGTISLEATASSLSINVSAILSNSFNVSHDATIDGVTIGAVSMTNVGTGDNNHHIYMGFNAESSTAIGARGAALVDDVTIGAIDLLAVAAVKQKSTVTFGALTSGETVTVGGLTLTATGAVTAAQVATAFSTVVASAGFAAANTAGTFTNCSFTSGTFVSTGSMGANGVFTAATASNTQIALAVSDTAVAATSVVNTTRTGVAQADDSDYEIRVDVQSNGEESGDIGTVTLGSVSIEVNDSAVADVNLTFTANMNNSGANDGDIESVTVGDVTLVFGENGEDDGEVTHGTGPSAEDLGGVWIQAVDDIINVEIGNWTITAETGSLIDQHEIHVSQTDNDGFIDSVTIGNVTLTANGTGTEIRSAIAVSAAELITSVEIGNVNLSALGSDGTVSLNITVDASSGDVESVLIGTINLNASGDGASAYASLNVSASDDIGSVEIGNVTVATVGDNADASLTIDVTGSSSTGAATELILGNISISATGVSAWANVDAYMSLDDSTGNIDIGNVTMNVIGSSATASLVVELNDDDAMDGGLVSIGNITATLSNSSDAGRDLVSISSTVADASVLVDISSDFDVEIGNITLTSVVDAATGRINTAGVIADFSIDANDGDITIGNITVIGGQTGDSGVTDVAGTNDSGIFNVSVTADGSILQVDDDVRYSFTYDQDDDLWRLNDVTFATGFSTVDFTITETASGDFEIYGDIGADDNINDLIATITFAGDASGGALTIDWDNTNVGSTVSAEIDITFTGENDLFNDTDSVSISLESGNVGEVVVDAAALEVLDNFQVLTDWLDLDASGVITIGDVDYSGYEADDVVIDVSNFSGASIILGGQGDTTITGNSDANNITIYDGDDELIFADGDSGITLATADYVNGFVAADDSLDLGLTGSATTSTGNYVEASSAVTGATVALSFAAALTAANTALATLAGTSSEAELYAFQYDSTNGYLFEDTDADGDADYVIVLVGINNTEISASDLVT